MPPVSPPYPALPTDLGGDAVSRCTALIDWLRDHGLLAMTLPASFGGKDASLADAVGLTFDLACRSGSAGLTYAMHLAQLHSWHAHCKGSAYLEAELRTLVSSGHLVASVVSEPETGGNIHRATAVMTGGDRLELVKESLNTSYVPDAGAFLVTAMDVTGAKPVQRLVMVRKDQTDAVERRRNTLMGMQGIDNRAWTFTFRYPKEAVFAEPFATIASATMTPATHLLWAALWSGLCASALDTAHRFVRKQLPAEVAATVQHRLSELRNRHYALNALIRDNLASANLASANLASERPNSPFAAAANINRLKIVGSQMARDIVIAAQEIIGLRAYAETGPYSLSEVLRDVLSGPLMVANARLQANTAAIDRYSVERP